MKPLRLVSLISLIYDIAIGVALLAGSATLARLFRIPPPQPQIFVETTAILLIAVGIAYVLPWRRPDEYRGYLWVMGPVLKGGGALTFVADHFVHGSPAAFLLFALTDGALAVATFWALVAVPPPAQRPRPAGNPTSGSASA